MREAIVKYFFQGVTLILVLIIILQTCNNKPTNPPVIQRDTIIYKTYYIYQGDTTIIKPTVRETIKHTDTLIKDTTLAKLIEEVKKLREELLSVNKYADTLKVDTIGTAVIQESIQGNKILERAIKYKLKIPTSDTTYIIKEPPKIRNKWFIGGGIGGYKQQPINDVNIGIGLLNKNDRLYELKTRIDWKGNIFGEFNTYWKIHF